MLRALHQFGDIVVSQGLSPGMLRSGRGGRRSCILARTLLERISMALRPEAIVMSLAWNGLVRM